MTRLYDTENWKIRRTMMRLRADAIERGMTELALTYGWSAIRLGFEALE